MKIKLILIRHGETETNVKGKLHKDKDNQTLNKTGFVQIQKTAKELFKHKPIAIYSSKEIRAIESAGIISEVCKVPHREVTGLQERNWGDFSGKPWSEIAKVLDKMKLQERYTYVPPNGESWKSFITRLKKAIKKLVVKNNRKTIIVVTHGGAIRALLPFLLDIPKEESFKYDPTNASITIFEYQGDRFSKIVVDDSSHL